MQYLTSKSEKLRNIIKHEASKEEGEENQLSSKWIEVDMSLLRYKDLDLLEGIFSLWMSKGREAMDVKKAFDVRVRQLMQSRVENKVGSISILLLYVLDGQNCGTLEAVFWTGKKIRIWVYPDSCLEDFETLQKKQGDHLMT